MEIVLNEDVSCEFEELSDIDLESIYLDYLSISYDDGTENYADYFQKKNIIQSLNLISKAMEKVYIL